MITATLFRNNIIGVVEDGLLLFELKKKKNTRSGVVHEVENPINH